MFSIWKRFYAGNTFVDLAVMPEHHVFVSVEDSLSLCFWFGSPLVFLLSLSTCLSLSPRSSQRNVLYHTVSPNIPVCPLISKAKVSSPHFLWYCVPFSKRQNFIRLPQHFFISFHLNYFWSKPLIFQTQAWHVNLVYRTGHAPLPLFSIFWDISVFSPFPVLIHG